MNNTFLGGNYGFKITACPSQSPVTWGWTHAPLLGATISGNTFQDTVHGGTLDVEHNAYSTSDAGRVYFSGTFADNTGVWTAPFLAAGHPGPTTFVTVGDALSADPGELVLSESGNLVNGPASVLSSQTLQVVSAALNGQAVRQTGYVLPSVNATPVQSAASPAPVVPISIPVAKSVPPVATPAPSAPAAPTQVSTGGTSARKSTTPVPAPVHPAGPRGVAQTINPVVRVSSSAGTSVRYWPGRLRSSSRFGGV